MNDILLFLQNNHLDFFSKKILKFIYQYYNKFLMGNFQKICYNGSFLQTLILKSFFNCANIKYDKYNINFDKSATQLIKKLFNKHVTKSTLIITSNSEHPKVQDILNQYETLKNVFKVSTDIKTYSFKQDEIFCQLKFILPKYKDVFVYHIGTTCGSGIETSQDFFIQLKMFLTQNNKKSIFVIDAVQELFVTKRDYNIFDYIIGTAHAVLPFYDTGFMFGKKHLVKKNMYSNTIFGLTISLFIILRNQSVIKQFVDILYNQFKMFDNKKIIIDNNEYIIELKHSSMVLFAIAIKNGKILCVENNKLKTQSETQSAIKDHHSSNFLLSLRLFWSIIYFNDILPEHFFESKNSIYSIVEHMKNLQTYIVED